MKMKNVLIGLMTVVSLAALVGSASGEVLWADDFENQTHPTNLGGAWTPGVAIDGGATQAYGQSWAEFSVRPAGMIDSRVFQSIAVCSNTSKATNASRPIGATYTDGTLILEGWVDSRSNVSWANNRVRMGLRGDGVDNQFPDIGIGYYNATVGLYYGGSTEGYWYDADKLLGSYLGVNSTNELSPTYYNEHPSRYNQWQHLRLELDMVGGLGVEARLYSDDDQTTPDGPWTLRITAAGLSIPQPTQVIVGGNRDYAVDEVSIAYVPEPISLVLLGLGGLGLIRRRR